MEISNNTSLSFKSIQMQLSKMNRTQRGLANHLYDILKYSDSYVNLPTDQVDIYMFPKAKTGIEIRFMDMMSGSFVRNNEDKIIKKIQFIKDNAWNFIDNVLDVYSKILNNTIRLPEPNISNIVNNKTEIVKLNPKYKDNILSKETKRLKTQGYSQKEAEVLAYNEYSVLFPFCSKDSDF